MVKFQCSYKLGIELVDCYVDDVLRFKAVEQTSFRGGWELHTLPPTKAHVGHFDTMCEMQQYIEEMDK